MKRIALIVALLMPVASFAQSNDFGVRASVGADYKIQKGLHLSVDEEIRVYDGLDRLQTTLGLSYKPWKFLKIGTAYSLINPYKKSLSEFAASRHRLNLYAAGYYTIGDFTFSLKETAVYTHRTGSFNKYQATPDAFALKSRIGAKYKGAGIFRPGLSFEMRTQLNGPWGESFGNQETNKEGRSYYQYRHDGYSHVYNDRYRLSATGDIRLSAHHTLTPYLMVDFCGEYEIDTNNSGDRIFSSGYADYSRVTVGINYVFSF